MQLSAPPDLNCPNHVSSWSPLTILRALCFLLPGIYPSGFEEDSKRLDKQDGGIINICLHHQAPPTKPNGGIGQYVKINQLHLSSLAVLWPILWRGLVLWRAAVLVGCERGHLEGVEKVWMWGRGQHSWWVEHDKGGRLSHDASVSRWETKRTHGHRSSHRQQTHSLTYYCHRHPRLLPMVGRELCVRTSSLQAIPY